MGELQGKAVANELCHLPAIEGPGAGCPRAYPEAQEGFAVYAEWVLSWLCCCESMQPVCSLTPILKGYELTDTVISQLVPSEFSSPCPDSISCCLSFRPLFSQTCAAAMNTDSKTRVKLKVSLKLYLAWQPYLSQSVHSAYAEMPPCASAFLPAIIWYAKNQTFGMVPRGERGRGHR